MEFVFFGQVNVDGSKRTVIATIPATATPFYVSIEKLILADVAEIYMASALTKRIREHGGHT